MVRNAYTLALVTLFPSLLDANTFLRHGPIEMKDLILRKMTGGDPNDPVTSGILVELDGVSPVPAPPAPELNWAAYVLVRET